MYKTIKLLGILCLIMFNVNVSYSQGVAINTDGSTANASAMLDVKSSNTGMLIPRMTQTERNAISSPASSLLIYQTDNTPGFYYFDGASWVRISIGTDSFDDADADPANEIQSISISGHDITLSAGGGTVTVPDNVNDADAVIGNEYQSLSISGHDISLSDGGGTVTVPDANTTYSAGNQLSLSGTTFNVNEGSGSGLDADLLDGHEWSEIEANDDYLPDDPATSSVNMNDYELQHVKALQGRDWDDDTGGADNKYRLLFRDGAHQFYNGGVVVGSYGNGTWTDLPDGRLIVEERLGVGGNTSPTESIDVTGSTKVSGDYYLNSGHYIGIKGDYNILIDGSVQKSVSLYFCRAIPGGR